MVDEIALEFESKGGMRSSNAVLVDGIKLGLKPCAIELTEPKSNVKSIEELWGSVKANELAGLEERVCGVDWSAGTRGCCCGHD